MTVAFVEHGHVASPTGWRAATAVCEIKYGPGRPDLALLCSDRLCAAAAIFTTNRVKAAPLLYDQALMQRNAAGLRAVVINSGNANACTGEPGVVAVVAMAQSVAQNLDIAQDTVFVMSTGTIGVSMPIEKITRGIAAAAQQLDPMHGPRAAEAIMTTDTRPKYCAVSVTLPGGDQIRIGGMAKGAGMIHPNMATMLGVITTDADVTPEALDAALRYAADRSFHCISVDGDTSTNDTLLVLANGMAGAPISDIQSADGQAFLEGLIAVCQRLAQAVVRDGEGVTRFVTITVRGAASDADAHRAAMAVARSPLVK
ncbi:MAG: bifunctional glutamate N-acetyltransferase/amino-acid acetyltransferase ArgJ, partial [Chloroflexales bacterium]|nr:bifunctional glutamate N-acetyltransferase/amino-acid acetyltransferase ArgJ [Chloroflexales bacterium]